MSGKLTDGFREIIELRWDEFVAMEQSLDATNFDSVITGIVRACKKGNLRAIQVALDRLDGKIASELEVEMPKFYTLYPYATKTVDDPKIIDEASIVDLDSLKGITFPETKSGTVTRASTPVGENKFTDIVGSPASIEEQEATEEELPTGSLRAVLEKMMDSPKSIVDEILVAADEIDSGGYSSGNPMVKSVIVAGLMQLVHKGRISAVFEVFDQIDGKVADKLKVLGGDVYVTRFDTIAPSNAVKNDKGIYQVEATVMTDVWGSRLQQLSKGKR